MRHVGFLPAAELDVRDAYLWYEERRPGPGENFLREVDGAVESVLAFPGAYPIIHRDVRRVLLERFPYGLFYRIRGQSLIVVACMHGARNPKSWRTRVDG